MNITIVGASRGTGAHLTRVALQAGHQVVALSRGGGPDLLEVPSLRRLAGDVRDPGIARRAVAGSDAVVVTLGMPPRDGSRARARGTASIVSAMQAEGVSRLVVQSSLGVGDSASQLPWFTARVIVPAFLRRAFDDHAAQEQLVSSSGLDWTLVRPGHLRRRHAARVDVGFTEMDRRHTGAVSRETLAEVLLETIADPTTVGRALAVSGLR